MLSKLGGLALVLRPDSPPGAEFKGTFLGKHVMVTTDPSTTTVAQLRAHLSHFNLSWTLRRIGELSAAADGHSFIEVAAVPVASHSLPYLAVVAIEVSTDDVPTVPTLADVAEAARIYNSLIEPDFTADRADTRVFEYLIRLGYSQFAGRVDLRNLIARTWILYHLLWPKTEQASTFDIVAAIGTETGLDLRQLMMFGFAYSGHSKPGYMTPYNDDALAMLPIGLRAGPQEQARFLAWVTASFAEVRQIGAASLPHEDYDKYRLSPFLVKPVVRPDNPPTPGGDSIRLVPIPRYLARRVTDGLYHALATANDQGGGTNPFRVAFGSVFEQYVGNLLHAGSGPTNVRAEWEYGRKGLRRRTPDWLVLDGNRLLVVEVKQSALKLNTKMLGRLDLLAADLERTLGEGARQLLKFCEDLSAALPGLEGLEEVREIELLLVTHDEVPWANWLMRDTIAKRVPGAGQIHFCSIDDFENLQRYCWGGSIFDLLSQKRHGPDHAHERDFREWLYQRGAPTTPNHPVLAQAFEELVASWGATPRQLLANSGPKALPAGVP